MKAFFRFLRGELNGFYLSRLSSMANKAFGDRADFLNKYARMQWKTEEQCTGNEVPIPHDQMRGICTVAGVFPPYAAQDSLLGSLRFTSSHKVDGVEYSERGLLDTERESFQFVRTDGKEYTTDINTLASDSRRTSVVEPGAQLLGFFREGDPVITTEGKVNTSYLYKFDGTPEEQYAKAAEFFAAQGKAYSPYYGSKYLFLAEESPIVAMTGDSVLIEIMKAAQYVRYNGTSLASLSMFARTLCPSFLFILRIEWSKEQPYSLVYYGIDEEYSYEDKLLRGEVFKLISAWKFKQFVFMESQITVERDKDGNPVKVTEVNA